MPERLLRVDDVRFMNSPEKIGDIFQTLGYNVLSSPLSVSELELSSHSSEAIWDAYLIADQRKGTDSLQVLLFHLKETEWITPSAASNRMRSIASSLCRRPSNFLLLGTRDYNQLLLVNPRRSFDAQMNLKVGVHKLLIDCTNPTGYDRDRLEALAAHNLDPKALYQAQCDAFDVEKLTKAFYQGYKEIFEKVQQVVRDYNPHSYFEDPSRLHQFSQRLLGRIMFLYFLQKKGFLNNDQKFLTHQYQNLHSLPEETDFYAQVLEPLFFNILNRKRPDHDSPLGKIPYLNGGLFDRDYDGMPDSAGWVTPAEIQLPNALFDWGEEKSILGFFNRYNFTVAENIQGDEDVAVDPEMLGKVFENLLAADERGQSGTFYTPRGIVQFMCVESLSRYLADESGVDIAVVRQLAEFDLETSDAAIKKLLSKEQTKRLKTALEEVKVCDPAVGSGAFPMGMMQVILTIRQAIARREGMTVQRGSLTMGEWKRHIIANNLYGVDIKPEAVEIAKLRMWLSLIVDIPSIDDVEALPNLDYKLMCGNSLISTIHGEQMIPDLTKDQQGMLNVTPIQAAIQPLLELQQQYFSAETEKRKLLREQIREAEQTVFRVAIADRRQYWQREQRKLEEDIQRLKGKASAAQTKKQQAIATKFRELEQIEIDVERGLRSIDFFQWHLHFNDVFAQKGGFDVVIGNPPYVRQEKLAEQFKQSLKAEFPELFKGTADIYTYFYGRGVELLRSNGGLAFITSNKWLRAGYGVNLRKHLAEACQIHSVIDFGELPVFDAATFPMILVAQKEQGAAPTIFTQVKSLELPYPDVQEIVRRKGQTLSAGAINGTKWTLTDSHSAAYLQKMERDSVALGEYVGGKIYRGILTGFNTAFKISGAQRAELIEEDPRSAEIIKPLAVGDDIRKWHIRDRDAWIIFTRRRINIDQYPAIKKHLSQWKTELTPKRSKSETVGRKPGRYQWYEIQDDIAYYAEFEKPKIIYPEICKESRFTFSSQGEFTNNKAFIITLEDYYLLGVLNSKPVWKYTKSICAALGDENKGGRLMLQWVNFKRLPIPQASSSDRKAISKLVQKCLDAKGQNVEQWEAEINDRVARLYGLTADEMNQIMER